MTSTLFTFALEAAVIVGGLVAGLFLVFSDFVMRSLQRATAAAGIESMQSINREIYRSVSMILFWAMPALSISLAVFAYLDYTGTASLLVIAGGGLGFVGVFMITGVFNVPMNKRLDALDFTANESAVYWKEIYLTRWVFWNHIRAAASVGATVCFLVARVMLASA